MTTLELAPPEQAVIPEWAPIISGGNELNTRLVESIFDYEEIAQLIEDEGVKRDEPQNLWVHFSGQYYHHYIGGLSCGDFIANHLLNDPEVVNNLYMGPEPRGAKYKRCLRKVIGEEVVSDFDTKSFILVDVPGILMDERAKEDPVGDLRSTLIHELLHFTEYIKLKAMWATASEAKRASYDRHEWRLAEEKLVYAKEVDIRQAQKYGQLFLAALKRGAGE